VIENKNSPYESKAGWIAYDQLYSGECEGFDKVVDNIIKELNFDKDSTHINVLILGIGTGIFELPLLAAIERQTKKTVNIVAIDLCQQPLYFVKELLMRGINNLPKSWEERKYLLENSNCWENSSRWQMSPYAEKIQIESATHWLIRDDIDFEPLRNDIDPLTGLINLSMGSKWEERLKAEKLILEGGFDIVISSFCLFHLTWWRRTLLAALDLLKLNGIMLYSQVGGDEKMFEGRHSKYTKSKEGKLIEEIFVKNFFKDKEAERYYNSERSSTATQPFGINAIMEELANQKILLKLPKLKIKDAQETTRVKQVEHFEYKITTKGLDLDCYKNLLDNRFFSMFRIIEDLVGTEYYNELLIKSLSKIEDKNKSDILVFDFRWIIYRKTKDIKKSRFYKKFFSGD